MKRTRLQRVICLILSVTLLLGSFGISASAGSLKGDESTSSTLEDMKALIGTSSYAEYISDYADKVNGNLSDIVIDVTDFSGDAYLADDSEAAKHSSVATPEHWENFGNNWNSSVYLPTIGATKKAGVASWNFTVTEEQEGLYYLYIEYYNVQVNYSDNDVEGGDQSERTSVSAIERRLKIDGKTPFDEVSNITFSKNWVFDNVASEVVTDAPAGAEVGTFISHKSTDDGYFKTVTEVYEEAGVKKQKVTTYEIAQDINGNSMSLAATQYSDWNTYICHDAAGYYEGYFSFFIAEGTHSISLEAEREPVIIKSITLVPATDTDAVIKTYNQVKAEYAENGYTRADGKIVTIEAEFPDAVSDASVAPSSDRSSAINSPISASSQLFNVIGKTGYESVGQWAAYKFTVNETGLYNLSARFKQDALQGMFICRSIKLSGGSYGANGSPTTPFVEANNARFNYDKKWQSDYIGDYIYVDKNGDEVDVSSFKIIKDGKFVDSNNKVVDVTMQKRNFEFYFVEGVEYTLYLECSLGDLKQYIQRVETALERVNECYLKILQRTGATPDEYQSYNFNTTMPEVLVTLLDEAIALTDVADRLEAMCGTNGSHLATLDNVARVLDTMGSNEGENIAANMETLKTYLGTLGTWINDSKRGVLVLDSICVVPADADERLPWANANFFQSIWFEITSFIYSFFTNYDQMGLTEIPDENTNTVDVWLAMGRDQSNIWRSMIDADGGFTDTYGAAVTLKLVTAGTLLPSILSGKGPDVYLGLGSAEVINYAIRDAVVGISGNAGVKSSTDEVFSSFVYEDANGNRHSFAEKQNTPGLTLVSEEFNTFVGNNFAPAAMKTLSLCDVTYGIPMTMGFAMMFYRMDVLAELGEEVPESWDEIIAILSVLQTNNMEIGVTYVNALDFMMYQMGGSMWKYTDTELYDSDYAGAKIDLDSEIALEAFDFVCRLYSDYSFPVTFDAANRFRTGEMPIVIGDYASIYNTLVVYATDIAGLWEFSSLPGSYEKETGNFNYDSLAAVTATVILNGCDDMLSAWQFVQWQTSEEIQSNYGNRMVALIGPSAKYETANINAIENLSWTANEKAAILNQMAHLDAIVNYPGSYIIARYMKFAFLETYNGETPAHEAMMKYIGAINAEITRKREEFELPTFEPGEEPPIKTTGTTTE